MHTQDLELLAAIGPAAATGVAVGVVDVRLHRTPIARLDIGHARPDIEHLDTELVAGDARIAEEGHLAEIAADIGAANADPMHAHERLPRPWFLRPGNVDALEILRCFKH